MVVALLHIQLSHSFHTAVLMDPFAKTKKWGGGEGGELKWPLSSLLLSTCAKLIFHSRVSCLHTRFSPSSYLLKGILCKGAHRVWTSWLDPLMCLMHASIWPKLRNKLLLPYSACEVLKASIHLHLILFLKHRIMNRFTRGQVKELQLLLEPIYTAQIDVFSVIWQKIRCAVQWHPYSHPNCTQPWCIAVLCEQIAFMTVLKLRRSQFELQFYFQPFSSDVYSLWHNWLQHRADHTCAKVSV